MFLLLVHLPICVSFVVCKLVLVWDRENRINKTQSVKWIPYDACIPLSGFSFPFLSWFVFYCLFVRSSLLQLNIGGNAKLATVPKAFDNQLISDFHAKAVLGEVHTKFIWRKKKKTSCKCTDCACVCDEERKRRGCTKTREQKIDIHSVIHFISQKAIFVECVMLYMLLHPKSVLQHQKKQKETAASSALL